MSKRIVIPVITIAVNGLALIILAKYMSIETINTGDTGNTVKLDFVQTKCVYPISVNEAKWQVAILLSNRGTRAITLSRVHVNQKQVDVYGLDHGDSLNEGSQVGTSISKEGLRVDPGNNYEVYIWIGNKLLSSVSQIIIQFNDPNSITMMKSITLS